MKLLLLLATVALAGCAERATITLNADEWKCEKKSTTIVMVPILVGKVTVMRAQPMTRCDTWQRLAP